MVRLFMMLSFPSHNFSCLYYCSPISETQYHPDDTYWPRDILEIYQSTDRSDLTPALPSLAVKLLIHFIHSQQSSAARPRSRISDPPIMPLLNLQSPLPAHQATHPSTGFRSLSSSWPSLHSFSDWSLTYLVFHICFILSPILLLFSVRSLTIPTVKLTLAFSCQLCLYQQKKSILSVWLRDNL